MTNKDILWCCVLLILFLTLASVTGCSPVVKIPVSEPCTQIPIKPMPRSPLADINDNSTLPEVAQAWVQDRELRSGYQQYIGPSK